MRREDRGSGSRALVALAASTLAAPIPSKGFLLTLSLPCPSFPCFFFWKKVGRPRNRNLFPRKNRCVQFDCVNESQNSTANHRRQMLTADKFSFFTSSWSFFACSFSFFTYSWSSFAYSGKVRLTRALRDCKQSNWTVSKKTSPTVSKKASPDLWSPWPPTEPKTPNPQNLL